MGQQNYGLNELFGSLELDPNTASMLGNAWESINGSSAAVDPTVFEPSRKAQWWNPFSWGIGAREARDNREAWFESGKESDALKQDLFNTILGNALSSKGLVEQAEVLGNTQRDIAKAKLDNDLILLGKTQPFEAEQLGRKLANDIRLAEIDANASKYSAGLQYDLGKLQDATQRYGIDKEFELGRIQDTTQRYGIDKEFDLGVKELSSLDNRALMSSLSNDFGNFMNAYGQSLGNLFAATAWRR